jgi:DNA-directed RNA polymerase specialized sigma24 family protein
MEDAELLRRYLEEQAEPAFAALVQRHLPAVYAVALRKTGGDAALAQEAAQHVFTALARKARALQSHPALAAWLFTSTHFAATQLVRAERRRRVRETRAVAMNENTPESPEAQWGDNPAGRAELLTDRWGSYCKRREPRPDLSQLLSWSDD